MKKVREKLGRLFNWHPPGNGGFNPQAHPTPKTPESNRARPLTRTSEFYYRRAGYVYVGLLLSSFLDAILFSSLPLERALPFGDVFLWAALFFLVIALTDFWKRPFQQVSKGIKQGRGILFDLQGKYSWVLFIILTLVFAAGFITKFKLDTFSIELAVQAFFALVVAGVSAYSILKQLRRAREKQMVESQDLALHIEQSNYANFMLVCAEMIAARLIAPLLCISALAIYSEISKEMFGIIATIGSLILISSQTPTRSKFQAPCIRCRRTTSKVALDGLCIECYANLVFSKPGSRGP